MRKLFPFFSLLFVLALTACQEQQQLPESVAKFVSFEGVNSDGRLFLDSLFGIVDSTMRYWIDTGPAGAECVLLEAQEDFNGDGLTDALVTDVQACGGNAIGNSFFFVTYTGDGRFTLSNSFGTNVYDDPEIKEWEGMKAVVIMESNYDQWSETYENVEERYVLVDTFAVRAEWPDDVTPMPTISVEEWQKQEEMADFGEDTLEYEEPDESSGIEIYDDLYSGKCSWYCGGDVQRVEASSCCEAKDSTYDASHAHDFDHESVWAPKGKGIGESLVYHFTGGCPRITTVKILNGDVKNEKAWKASARVKMIKMYFNDKPYALLALQDSRTLQCFNVGIVGFNDSEAPDWTLRFEIMDVYEGAKNASPVISELYFDGIDVH